MLLSLKTTNHQPSTGSGHCPKKCTILQQQLILVALLEHQFEQIPDNLNWRPAPCAFLSPRQCGPYSCEGPAWALDHDNHYRCTLRNGLPPNQIPLQAEHQPEGPCMSVQKLNCHHLASKMDQVYFETRSKTSIYAPTDTGKARTHCANGRE